MKNKDLPPPIAYTPVAVSSLEESIAFAANMGKIYSERALNAFSVPRALYLYGSLGAGKTTFTRAFVSAFAGAEEAEVASPSFTICNEYPTHPEIFHADLYRLPENIALPEELHDMLALQDEADKCSFHAVNVSDKCPTQDIEFLEKEKAMLADTQNPKIVAPLLILEWPERLAEKEKERDRVDIFLFTKEDKNFQNWKKEYCLKNNENVYTKKLDKMKNSCDKKGHTSQECSCFSNKYPIIQEVDKNLQNCSFEKDFCETCTSKIVFSGNSEIQIEKIVYEEDEEIRFFCCVAYGEKGNAYLQDIFNGSKSREI